MLATGRCMPRMNFPGDENEQEKILGALALEGASLVSFDNVSSSRPFGGSPIERALTVTGKIKFRILGVSDVPALLWLAVLAATGNNISFTPDAVRRVLISRLKSLEARPEINRLQAPASDPARAEVPRATRRCRAHGTPRICDGESPIARHGCVGELRAVVRAGPAGDCLRGRRQRARGATRERYRLEIRRTPRWWRF